LLNSTGRKTGRKRTTPVGYIRDGDCYVITASNGGAARHPAWFYNLQSNPQTTIEVMGETLAMVAQVATPEEKKRLWAELIKTAPGFEQYQKRTTREIPMIILCPVEKGA
jgi:deazaflavin-dependent oxidoreductase (nitroreductase family)